MICIVCNKEFKTTNSRQSKLTCSSKCNHSYYRNIRREITKKEVEKGKSKIPETFKVIEYVDRKICPRVDLESLEATALNRKLRLLDLGSFEYRELKRKDGHTKNRRVKVCKLSDIEKIIHLSHSEYKRTYNLNYRHNRDFYNKILNKLGGTDD